MQASFPSLQQLRKVLVQHDVDRIFCKRLVQNDNSKQQIYLWRGDWSLVNLVPLRGVTAALGKRQRFKAGMDFHWLLPDGTLCRAPGAQLIMYPDYPEIRLSGFLRGCKSAPAKNLQPVAGKDRGERGLPDGRILVLGVSSSRVIAYLAVPGTSLVRALADEIDKRSLNRWGVIHELRLGRRPVSIKQELLAKLGKLNELGEVSPVQKTKNSLVSISSATDNAAGYTLEAHLGIASNARPEADYKGWELKAFSTSKITVIEPEPDGGRYARDGCRAFLRAYGRPGSGEKTRFVGQHKVGTAHAQHGTTLQVRGYDPASNRILDVKGAIELIDKTGAVAASWSFASLIEHWSTKHSQAVYVPYKKGATGFTFVTKSRVLDVSTGKHRSANVVWVCEGTDFSYFLRALSSRSAFYDPGSSILTADLHSSSGGKLKARNQFRVTKAGIAELYDTVAPTPVR